MHIITDVLYFPPLTSADGSGLLAIGGDLSTERLIIAYRSGIFPWYNEDEPICWWSPDPRFVLFPEELKVSKSMERVVRSDRYRFTVNEAFEQVITNCSSVSRAGQGGTWISPEMKTAYIKLHHEGYAHSAEAWEGEQLVGGLYGIRMGKMFFGESMFSLKSNASKFAFIKYVEALRQEEVQLIDCQLHTNHLESLGARMIGRDSFARYLDWWIGA